VFTHLKTVLNGHWCRKKMTELEAEGFLCKGDIKGDLLWMEEMREVQKIV
jgi:hypothetical protein